MLTAAEALAILQGKQTEEQVMQAILAALRAHGFDALSTVHRLRMATCPKCATRFYPLGNYGADKGVADLLVRHDGMPLAHWVGMECKGKSTPLSVEQKELEKRGAIIVVRSVAEALEAMKR